MMIRDRNDKRNKKKKIDFNKLEAHNGFMVDTKGIYGPAGMTYGRDYDRGEGNINYDEKTGMPISHHAPLTRKTRTSVPNHLRGHTITDKDGNVYTSNPDNMARDDMFKESTSCSNQKKEAELKQLVEFAGQKGISQVLLDAVIKTDYNKSGRRSDVATQKATLLYMHGQIESKRDRKHPSFISQSDAGKQFGRGTDAVRESVAKYKIHLTRDHQRVLISPKKRGRKPKK